MDLGNAIQKSVDLYLKNFGLLFVAGLLVLLLSVVTIGILAGPLIGGFIILVLKIQRGEKADFNEIFALWQIPAHLAGDNYLFIGSGDYRLHPHYRLAFLDCRRPGYRSDLLQRHRFYS